MLVIMSCLAFGVVVGFLFREKERFLLYADRITGFAIYMLLFFLGISIGINEEVMNHIFAFGLKSLVLSLGAILGSVLFSYVVYLFFFREIEK